MNCLKYCLNFWDKNRDYEIWYNSSHCINLPKEIEIFFPNKEFLEISSFGFEYFKQWHTDSLINDEDLKLLKEYFNIK